MKLPTCLLFLLTVMGSNGSWGQESIHVVPIPTESLLRYEATGLSLLRPYQRGRMPIVLVHGLWASPWSWQWLVAAIESDPAIRDHFQVWTFGYSTGDPIPYSAHLLRKSLDEVRRQVDPTRSDVALDRMVMVGHSMGGLLTRMMAIDPGDRIWRVVSERPFDAMMGDPEDIELFRNGLLFGPRPEIRRMIFIATPHEGSKVDTGSLHKLGTRLVRQTDPLKAAHRRLVDRNPTTYFRDSFRKGLPSSIDELS